ncbi:virulence RhuM family protein [Candidatus Saccharibacteria bacterium]|nr:virulence RhuM family protein [Candidatus Saccharibacteria bacterium]
MTQRNTTGIATNNGDFMFYNSPDGKQKISAYFKDETVWLTQKGMAELFDVQKSAISKHLSNIFSDKELDEDSVVSILETTAKDHKIYKTKFYNLDAILSVGYRVNSKKAIGFRRWASSVLKEYLIKGFAMDDDRLKGHGGGGYWKELLDRIRDIRSSEKVIYRQVLDLYATAVDYDPKDEKSVLFFKIVQNKLHYAAHGHTAAEIIYERADAEKPFMGLKSFEGELPVLREALVAKNYLDEKEIKILNNIVSGYFDFAEIQAIRHHAMKMEDYLNQLDSILKTTGGELLDGAGKISHEVAMDKAAKEYRKYQVKTISPVEKAYLDSLKKLEKAAAKSKKLK